MWPFWNSFLNLIFFYYIICQNFLKYHSTLSGDHLDANISKIFLMIFSFFSIILLCFTLFFNENILASAPISLTNELSTGLLTLRTGFTDSFQDILPFPLSCYGFRFGLVFITPPGRQAALVNCWNALLGLSTSYRLASFLGLFGLLDFFSPWQIFWEDLGWPNIDCFDDVFGHTKLHLTRTKFGRVDTQPRDLPFWASGNNNGFKFSRRLVTPMECSGTPSEISLTYWIADTYLGVLGQHSTAWGHYFIFGCTCLPRVI